MKICHKEHLNIQCGFKKYSRDSNNIPFKPRLDMAECQLPHIGSESHAPTLSLIEWRREICGVREWRSRRCRKCGSERMEKIEGKYDGCDESVGRRGKVEKEGCEMMNQLSVGRSRGKKILECDTGDGRFNSILLLLSLHSLILCIYSIAVWVTES
ncbi:hypothetical protein RIF29_21554 [Crotalaria pallida]|uniref:Transmembrane protein n=1 Tax=Crotalaria pallida TaxID=3830 RepID=A0AAN9F7N0_CROPI